MARQRLTPEEKAARLAAKQEPTYTTKKENEVVYQTLPDIVTPELEEGAIYNDEFTGFHEDYLVIHCLLKIHKPKKLLEIGTNTGTGTNIICNAIPDAEVLSLDLPYELNHLSKQQPLSEGKGYLVGAYCKRPYTQLWGNSLEYDYTQHKDIEGWFIDGEHEYVNVKHESKAAVASGAKIIIYHDADMAGVWQGITEVLLKTNYTLYRVNGTRIAYALK